MESHLSTAASSPPSTISAETPRAFRYLRTGSLTVPEIPVLCRVIYSVAPLGLSAKIALAVVRLEECPDRPVSIEGEKRAACSVEPRCGPIASHDFLDVSAHGTVTKCLRREKIFLLRDAPELTAVLREM